MHMGCLMGCFVAAGIALTGGGIGVATTTIGGIALGLAISEIAISDGGVGAVATESPEHQQEHMQAYLLAYLLTD